MARTTKKTLKAPATVTVVYEDTEVEFKDVLELEELEDGSLDIGRFNNKVRVRPIYRYYEITYEE